MPAGATKGYTIPLRSDAARDDALHVGAIDGYEGGDPSRVFTSLEQMTDAAQIPRPFFPDICYKQQIGVCPNACRIHRPQPGQQHGKATRIVSNAGGEKLRSFPPDLHAGPRRKHRIEMGGKAQKPLPCPAPQCGHVSFGINPRIIETMRQEQLQKGLCPFRFLKRRGRNLGQSDYVSNGSVMVLDQLGRGCREGLRSDDPLDDGFHTAFHPLCSR